MVKHLTNPMAERPAPLGTLLSSAGRRLAQELDTGLAAAGFSDVRSAHAPLFMAIDPRGSSLTDLADRAHMTKQAMGELVRHLEAHGYVELAVDQHDRRVRRVTLTARGWEALELGVRVIESFESWLEEAVGPPALAALRRTLVTILASESADWQHA